MYYNIYICVYHVYNLSQFLTRQNVLGHQKAYAEVLRHTLDESTTV